MTEQHLPPAISETEAADRATRRTLRRALEQWWLIVLCGVVAAAAAYGISSTRAEQFQATSTLQVGEQDAADQALANADSKAADPERAQAAVVELFSLPSVRNRASEMLGGRVTPDELLEVVTVESQVESGVIRVSAHSTDPAEARATANAMVQAMIRQRQNITQSKIDAARARINERLSSLTAEGKGSITEQDLMARRRELTLASTLDDGNVTVTQPALQPTSPYSPRPIRDAFFALLGGFLLGLAIVLIRARMDDRIRDPEEFTELWNLPLAGVVPQADSLKHGGAHLPSPEVLEALALARTNLRYLQVGGSVKTVLITSALAGEGKSTLGWNLAIASSLASARVLVVEADLRRPKLSARLGIGGPGLSEVLVGLASPQEAIRRVDVAGPGSSVATSVDVMPAGMAPPSPIALLEDPRARDVLAELRARYDIVYIDTPPATVVGDAVALVDAVDGVLVVSRLGTVQRDAYRRLHDILVGAGAPVLAQLTNSDSHAKTYGYYATTTGVERTGAAAASPKATGAHTPRAGQADELTAFTRTERG
ncbi:MAG: hypothetical protein J7513_00395 [Solirubrobacteraceae bacterium]|nr:hypothetical protein [Solirubrobacteraceae bacterium]